MGSSEGGDDEDGEVAVMGRWNYCVRGGGMRGVGRRTTSTACLPTSASEESGKGMERKHVEVEGRQGEDEPGWTPLRDTYMLGSKLKDWDKAQDYDVAKPSEIPFVY
ncbi:RRP15-like protein [Hordeum vulgare]|nr:RRP15-like protein [Hordeum vulgare]